MRYGTLRFSVYFVDICQVEIFFVRMSTTGDRNNWTCPCISWAGCTRYIPLRYGRTGTQGRDTVPLVHCPHLSCGGDDGGLAVLVCSVTGIVSIHGRGGACQSPALLLLLLTAASGGPNTQAAAAARHLRPRRPESSARSTPQRLA